MPSFMLISRCLPTCWTATMNAFLQFIGTKRISCSYGAARSYNWTALVRIFY